MKVAVIQTNATEDRARNIDRASALVGRAIQRKARLILLPEAYSYRGRPDPKKGHSPVAEKFYGPSTEPLGVLAKKHHVHILSGTVCEKISGSKKVYNTSVLINNSGRIVAKYRKINLFDAVIGNKKLRESDKFRAGKQIATAKVGRWKLGLSICYDLRFPELYRRYARLGVNVFCVPSAFTKKTGQAHWETLLRARAIENLCYVLAPNQAGKDSQGVPSFGNSMIIDPWGKILARASGSREEVLFADLRLEELKRCRKILPGQGA